MSTVPTLALADAECMDLSDIVDTERYPLQAPGSQRMQELVEMCRQQLAAEGSYVLPGFLRPEAMQRVTEEGRVLAQKTFFSPRQQTNAYFTNDDPTLPASDPRRFFMDRTSNCLVIITRINYRHSRKHFHHPDIF